jgi:type III secretion system YscQ/HrcQ family protein
VKRVRPYPFDRLPRVAHNQVEAGRIFRAHLPIDRTPGFTDLERGLGGALHLRLVECFVSRARDLEALIAGVVVRLAAPGERWALIVIDRALAVALAGAALGIDGAGAELPAPRPPTLAEIGALELIVQLLVEDQALRVVGVVEPDELLGLLSGLADDALVHVLEARVDSAVGRGGARVIVPQAYAVAAPIPRARVAVQRRRARLDAIRAEAVVELGRAPIVVASLGALRLRDVLAFPVPSPSGAKIAAQLRVARGAFDASLAGERLTLTGPFRLHPGVNMSETSERAEDAGADQLLRELPVEIVCELGRVTLSGRELIELEPGAVIPIARPLAGPIDLTAAGRLVARGELVDVEGDLGVRLTEVVE